MKAAKFRELSEKVAAPEHYLRYVVEEIERHVPEATVWAFGSRVKGSCRAESDLDLAVVCDEETAKKLARLGLVFTESDVPFRVQLLDFNRLPENMQENIKKDYVVLYEP